MRSMLARHFALQRISSLVISALIVCAAWPPAAPAKSKPLHGFGPTPDTYQMRDRPIGLHLPVGGMPLSGQGLTIRSGRWSFTDARDGSWLVVAHPAHVQPTAFAADVNGSSATVHLPGRTLALPGQVSADGQVSPQAPAGAIELTHITGSARTFDDRSELFLAAAGNVTIG